MSDNHGIGQPMGPNGRRISGLAMALALAVTAIAGILSGIRIRFDPTAGAARLIHGIGAAILGALVRVTLIAASRWAGRADLRLMGDLFLHFSPAFFWD